MLFEAHIRYCFLILTSGYSLSTSVILEKRIPRSIVIFMDADKREIQTGQNKSDQIIWYEIGDKFEAYCIQHGKNMYNSTWMLSDKTTNHQMGLSPLCETRLCIFKLTLQSFDNDTCLSCFVNNKETPFVSMTFTFVLNETYKRRSEKLEVENITGNNTFQCDENSSSVIMMPNGSKNSYHKTDSTKVTQKLENIEDNTKAFCLKFEKRYQNAFIAMDVYHRNIYNKKVYKTHFTNGAGESGDYYGVLFNMGVSCGGGIFAVAILAYVCTRLYNRTKKREDTTDQDYENHNYEEIQLPNSVPSTEALNYAYVYDHRIPSLRTNGKGNVFRSCFGSS